MFQTGRSDQTGYIKTTIAARLTLREKFSRLTSRGVWFSPGPEPGMSCSAEKASRVTFKIEPFLDVARLTLTHDKLEEGSKMLKGVTEGWPKVLSSLKTLLETGQAI